MSRSPKPDDPKPVAPYYGEEADVRVAEAAGKSAVLAFWYSRHDAQRQRILEVALGVAPLHRMLADAARKAQEGKAYFALLTCLAETLADPGLEVRRMAARLIAEAFTHLAACLPGGMAWCVPPEMEHAVSAIVEAVGERDEDSGVRGSLLTALEHSPVRRVADAIEPLSVHLFADPNPGVVTRSLGLVMACGIDRSSLAIPAIVALLGHSAAEVRRMACEALAKFGPEANCAVQDLVGMALAEENQDLRRAAANTLVAIDHGGALSGQALVDQDRRGAFLALLREIGPEARSLRVPLQYMWRTRGEAKKPKKTPSWNKQRGILKYGDRIARTVKVKAATTVVPILDCFEEEGWPEAIDNFLDAEVDTLKDALGTLNTGIKEISFYRRGGSIYWKEVP